MYHSQKPPVIEVRNLTVKVFNRTILNIPELKLEEGEVLGIFGPNGAGKTTLVKSMALLRRPTTGQVYFLGNAVRGAKAELAARRQMAVVFQDPLLLDMTVIKNVMLGLLIKGEEFKAARTKALCWLRKLGIEHLASRMPYSLSRGEAQRAALARAFVLSPRVLFLDEPFSALDTPTRLQLIEEFQDIVTETKTTTVLVTHDLSELASLATKIVVLINGNISQVCTPSDISNSKLAKLAGMYSLL